MNNPRKITPDFFGVAIACQATNRVNGQFGHSGFVFTESDTKVSLRKGRRSIFDALKFHDPRKDQRTIDAMLEKIRIIGEAEHEDRKSFMKDFLSCFDDLLEHFCPAALPATTGGAA